MGILLFFVRSLNVSIGYSQTLTWYFNAVAENLQKKITLSLYGMSKYMEGLETNRKCSEGNTFLKKHCSNSNKKVPVINSRQ